MYLLNNNNNNNGSRFTDIKTTKRGLSPTAHFEMNHYKNMRMTENF